MASQVQKSLRIFLRDAGPLGTLAGQLAVKGEGQVSFVVIKEGGQGEVEIELPDRYRSRRRSPRPCGRCPAWSRWSWCRAAQ